MDTAHTAFSEKPTWLKKKISSGRQYQNLHEKITGKGLHTVCTEACCPNQAECYSNGTSTFMIMGDRCTRNCRFCAVVYDNPLPIDSMEPFKVADTILEMGLKYAVITSVTRDDLEDGGADHFASTIRAIKDTNPQCKVEVLVPDFQGDISSLQTVAMAGPDVFNHNIETVPRLYSNVRPQADYKLSLSLFNTVKDFNPSIITKSGLMLGLGETIREIQATIDNLQLSGCDILTLGQYLQPTAAHYPIAKYIRPADFEKWKQIALDTGFKAVAAGPFVRSSYHALETYEFVANQTTGHGRTVLERTHLDNY